jgi:hypothetical protein
MPAARASKASNEGYLSKNASGRYTVDVCEGDRAARQSPARDRRSRRPRRMPADLTRALESTKDIPVDLDPKFSFQDEVR